MQLIEKFHQMETDYSLFELGQEQHLPLWDIIRYSVYIKYYYPEEDRKRIETPIAHKKEDYFKLVWKIFVFFLKIPFVNARNIVVTASRYKNDKGFYYDKSAKSIVDCLENDVLVLEPILGKKMAYPYLYDFGNVFRRLKTGREFPIHEFQLINTAIVNTFGENLLDYTSCNRLLLDFKSDYIFYKAIFSIKKTKKIFIATGNPKGIVLAAKSLGVKSYLLQHGSIELDEVEYSYPKNIKRDNNLLFPDLVLTLGDYWCNNLNVPTNEVVSIGNDFFYDQPNLESDGSVLVISTIVHGRELSEFVKSFAPKRPDLNFAYKLHPNEAEYYNYYTTFFEGVKNVKVISSELDINYLIAKSNLVLLIVSAALYEALNQNKKVAIYKKINYRRQLHLCSLPNIFFFETIVEFLQILERDSIQSDVNFYKPTDYSKILELISGS